MPPKSQLAQWQFTSHTHAVPSVVMQARQSLGKSALHRQHEASPIALGMDFQTEWRK